MRAIAVIPTYNESANIKDLIDRILGSDERVSALVVDDQSPDGTASVVEKELQNSSRIHFINKTDGRNGRAAADILGLKYALDNNFDCILQMDADFSHQPKYIPSFLDNIERYDVVVGSRLIKGGVIIGRGILRNIVTVIANFYVRVVLGWKVKDWTSGFRCYRKKVLESINLDAMSSKGPALLEEILFECLKKDYSVREIPIEFTDRKKGASKLTLGELAEVFVTVLKIRFKS